MIGEAAYYLLSPFNLLFVFFPGKYLTSGLLKNLVFNRSHIVYNIKVVSKVQILVDLC